MGAFDNFNEEVKKKDVTHGKSVLMHIGTAFFFKKNWPLALPVGTNMTSPWGIKLIVVSCALFNLDTYLVCGQVIPRDDGVDTVFDEREVFVRRRF